eukprot:scaffold262607_cov86-Attheya_sp.AAC.2
MMKWGSGTNHETKNIPMLLQQLGFVVLFGSSMIMTLILVVCQPDVNVVVTAFSSSSTTQYRYRYSSSSFSQGRIRMLAPRRLVERSIFSTNNGPVCSRIMSLGMTTSDDKNNDDDDDGDEGQEEKDSLMPSFLVQTSLSELLLDNNEEREVLRPGSLAAATREMGRVPYGEAYLASIDGPSFRTTIGCNIAPIHV